MINTHVTLDSWDVNTAAFWLGQLARWLDDPDHANHFAQDLWGIDEDYNPPLTLVIASAAQALRDSLKPGPNQTVTPGPDELDTSSSW